MQGIPPEWLVELDPESNTCRAIGADQAHRAGAKREKEEGRKDGLRHAILGVLPANREQAMTRDEIWEKLPDAVRVNQVRFKSVMEAGVPADWLKEGGGGNGHSYRYWVTSA